MSQRIDRGLRLCALAMAWLAPSSLSFGMQITEIMYHPAGDVDAADSLEWVELFNDSGTPFDLSEHFFSDGIRFAFDDGSIIEGRSYLVVCSNLETFREAHPDVENVVGPFEGNLENAGERITLSNGNGGRVVSVRYKDGGRWPARADGPGYSLALDHPMSDPTKVGHWTHSFLRGGSPGRENFPPPIPVDTEIVPFGDAERPWRVQAGWDEATQMMAEFSDPPGAWIAPDFDDAAWLDARAPIGFGEDEFNFVVEGMEDNFQAFAVRTQFELTAEILEEMEFIQIHVKKDDGVVVYVNGTEVGRVGIPEDLESPVSAFERAVRSAEFRRPPDSFVVPRELLREGENVVAISVHNINLGSGDAGVDMSVSYRTLIVTEPPRAPHLRLEEIGWEGAGAQSFVEIRSYEEEEFELSGLFLSNDPDNLQLYEIPPGSFAAPGGPFVVLGAALPFDLDAPPGVLFLTDETGEHVVDAAALSAPATLPETDWSHTLDPRSGRFVVSIDPTPDRDNSLPLEDGLVISEIHYHPVTNDDLEFFEIFNRSERTIELDAFSVSGGYNFVFPEGSRIATDERIVLARRADLLADVYDLGGIQVFGPGPDASPDELDAFGRLSNRGETIELRDAFGNIIDSVRYYDGGDWSQFADGGGSSLELIDPTHDNSGPSAWEASDESESSEWTEFSIAGQYASAAPGSMEPELQIYFLGDGECLIDDVSIRVAQDPDVEYCPNPGFEERTTPWRLTGNHIFSERTTLDAHSGKASLLAVSTGSGDQKVNHVEVDTRPSLRFGQDVTVRFWARWLRGMPRLHVMLYNNVVADTITLPVPLDAGSPGRENKATVRLRETTGSDNLGPVVDETRHWPAVPPPGLPIKISARVSDADGVQSVSVFYRPDADDPVDYESAQLFDDGAHDDGAANDGVYAGTIPAQASDTRVQFFVAARDSFDNERSYPLAGGEAPLVFITEEGFFQTAAAETDLLRYRLVVDEANWDELQTRLLHSDDLISGTFIYEEREVFYNVGLRYRGSPWNRPPKQMFRVRIPNDNPLRGTQRRINISRYGNTQHEGMGYQLIRKMSRPWSRAPHTPRYEYIDVNLNGRPFTGDRHSAEIQPIDTQYTEFWWPGDAGGWNYKITGKLAFTDAGLRGPSPAWTQFRFYGPSKEDVRFYYNPGIRKIDDHFDPLVEFLRVFDSRQVPNDEFEEQLEAVMNVEASLRVYAVRDFIADWDTIGIGNGQNAFLYHAPIEGKMYLLPWDMDHAFEDSGRAMPSMQDVGVRRILTNPKFRRIYARILDEGLRGGLRASYTDSWMDGVAAAAPAPRTQNPGAMKTFLNTRRSRALSVLRSAQGATFTVPERVEFEGNTAIVEGTAPLEVDQILVAIDGGDFQPLDPAWSTASGRGTDIATVWTATLEGLDGVDSADAEVVAFSSSGDLAGSGTTRLVRVGIERDFIRGDSNGDGDLVLADAVFTLNWLFRNGAEPPCLDAADTDDNGILNLTDPVRLLRFLFLGDEAPPAPQGEPGPDPTDDELSCDVGVEAG